MYIYIYYRIIIFIFILYSISISISISIDNPRFPLFLGPLFYVLVGKHPYMACYMAMVCHGIDGPFIDDLLPVKFADGIEGSIAGIIVI